MKAIIFDMGGVLVDLDMDACRNAFKYDLGFEEIDTILDPCHQKGIIGDLEEGLVTAEEFRKYVLERSREGATEQDVDEAFAKILVGIEPSKIELLKKLSAEYDIYMLSNNNPVALPYSARMFEDAGFSLKKDFKKCFISYQMKMLKPSEAFYKAVMNEIGLPASEMIFIDDSQKNVDAAIAAGLPAVWYEPGTDLAAVVDTVINA
jgi:putative hydrolase of the HAD superfamily